jgi:hypothetical protein
MCESGDMSGKSKPTVWRRQESTMEAGVDRLLRDKTCPPGKPRLSQVVDRHTLPALSYRRVPPAGAG